MAIRIRISFPAIPEQYTTFETLRQVEAFVQMHTDGDDLIRVVINDCYGNKWADSHHFIDRVRAVKYVREEIARADAARLVEFVRGGAL